jgi:hypothetical protein
MNSKPRADKVGVVVMPFEHWRRLLGGHVHSEEELSKVRAAHSIAQSQIAAQSFHANCSPPQFSVVRSARFPTTSEIRLTCECGEVLMQLDNIKTEQLESIGPRGAFRPDPSAN